MQNPKRPASFRLTDDAHRLIRELAKKLGINQTSVIETAVRTLAKRERVK